MQGNRNKDDSYFVCEYRDDLHSVDGSDSDFIIYCKKHEHPLADKSACGMDCPDYGYCDNCRGFSAVGCQVCVIPRPVKR